MYTWFPLQPHPHQFLITQIPRTMKELLKLFVASNIFAAIILLVLVSLTGLAVLDVLHIGHYVTFYVLFIGCTGLLISYTKDM